MGKSATAAAAAKWIKTFLAEENGATAIEYAIVASLIAVTIVSAVTALGGKVQGTYNEVASNMK